MVKYIIIVIIVIIFLLRKYIKIIYNLNNTIDIDTNKDKDNIILNSVRKKDPIISYYEGIYISPSNIILLVIIKNMYDSVKHILIKPIDDYVTFTRLNLSSNNRMYCDWCSIVNGFLKLYIDSINYHIKNNINLICNINKVYTKLCKKYLSNAIFFRHKKIKKRDVDIFIQQNFVNFPENIYDIIYNVSNIALGLEQIELRWCPFRSMQQYFRNTNPNFVPINKVMIYKVGEILSKYDTIECIFCNQVIHEEIDPKYISNNPETSPMFEFYNFLKL